MELLASGDVDLLYDTRQRLTLVSQRLEGKGLLGLLKKADRSFECVRPNGFRAANAGQFMVDLVIAPRPLHEAEPITFADQGLVDAEVPGLQWLLSVPPLEAVAIDEQGWPVPLRVPDPRAFAFHKAWLSQRMDREPVKKPRDLAQACAMARLIRDELPQFSFAEPLTALPKTLANVAALESTCGLADLARAGPKSHDQPA
ncbi:GSU2403 family nucleotidyltransferase fold protein [Halochromatium roseum]|uniref:GSU2403 family nucleotidyltransferase fold protein n=1 Tax=Halochromatium roseum TaxID=391920 RepID=UPI001F5E1187|nr:GSU2403 family nucleotidyltransferase fold protein [Halochromatium roseum]